MHSPTVPETRAARLRKLFLATLYPVGGRFCTADFPDTKRKRSLTFVSDLGAPEETRTPDLLIRSQTLYPAELPARNVYYNTIRSPKCQAFFQKKFLLF